MENQTEKPVLAQGIIDMFEREAIAVDVEYRPERIIQGIHLAAACVMRLRDRASGYVVQLGISPELWEDQIVLGAFLARKIHKIKNRMQKKGGEHGLGSTDAAGHQ